jgi:choline dehydrogenase-like flavoprotein
MAGEEISPSSYDYAIVGSGAGGGAAACNLAKAAQRVVLLEAGGDHENYNYQVPALIGLATEDEDLRWDYYVRHYASDERQRHDSKFVPDRDEVLYPGVGTLGGCTAHNDMNGPAVGRVSVEREVIVSAGAFNISQLLKLLGEGSREELTDLGIEVRVDHPRVGENLRDGQEVGVIYEMKPVLKAHTLNTAGKVTLRSDDPRIVPHINFHSFDEGNDTSGDDLEALVEGLKFVRRIMGRTGEVVEKESVSGKCVSTRELIREFARNEAWGHHAPCTCKMGLKEDEMAVVDNDYRVRDHKAEGGGRVGLPSHPRFLHRYGRVHDQREGERCHPRRRDGGNMV